jgi:hypothetical protein
MKSLAEVRKTITALIAFGGVVVANNLVTGSTLRWVNAAIALGGAVLIYFVPNAPPAPVATTGTAAAGTTQSVS